MKKLLFTLMMLLAAVHCSAVSFGVNPRTGMQVRTPSKEEPIKNVTISNSGIEVSYEIRGVNLTTDDVFTTAHNVSIPGLGHLNTEAQPAYPFKADRFELPEGCEKVLVRMTDFKYSETDIILAPARILLADSQDYVFTTSNIKHIGVTSISSGKEIITYYTVTEKDGKKVLEVGIQPIQYDSAKGVMRTYYDFKYQISYQDANGNPLKVTTITPASSFSAHKLSYLILSIPEYSDICEEFAKFKCLRGFNPKVVLSNNWTTESIRDVIKEHYANTDERLAFVLLVGGNKDIPSNVVYTTAGSETNSTTLSDYYYSCLDYEGDFEQDVYIGRIPADNVSEAETAINKILQYQRNPVEDSNFYTNALHCAHYQIGENNNSTSRYFIWTSETLRDYMQELGYNVARVYKKDSNTTPTYYPDLFTGSVNLLPSDLRSTSFNWNGSSQDIISRINSGVFYVLHRDHGSSNGWGSPQFTSANISSLNNSNKLPIVFSINCLTGDFSKQCFASKFLLKENGGCAAAFAASNISYSRVNDYLSIGMFNSVWRTPGLINPFTNQHGFMRSSPIYSLGEILDEGMEYVCTRYGSNNNYYKVTRERFHIFGDPSMLINTRKPEIYDKHTVNKTVNSYTSAKIDISVNNDTDDVYLAISNFNNQTATIYTGTNIEYSGYVNPYTRIWLYGVNIKPVYITTGVEAYEFSDLRPAFELSLIKNNISLTRDSLSANKSMTVVIYDTNMNVVKTIYWLNGEESLQIDTSTIKSGQYILTVQSDGVINKSWNIII